MKIITLGGGCQDIYMHFAGADTMSIRQQQSILNYLLFQSGQKIEIRELNYLTGGGATNTAVSFSRLGFKVDTACALGEDSASLQILDELKKEKIGTSLIQLSQHPTGVSFIIKSLSGERTILVNRGANSHLKLDHVSPEKISDCNYLYITSLSRNATKLLPQLTTLAKKHNIPVAINPGTSQLKYDTLTLKQSLKNIDILIMNSSEAQTFMLALTQSDEKYKKILEFKKLDRSPCSPNQDDETAYLMHAPLVSENIYFSIRKFFTTTIEMGPSIVVVTNGCNGVYVATKEQAFFHPAIKTDVVDNVGAGDSFGSCFVGSLMLNYSIEDALRNGITNSAAVLAQMGAKAGLLTHSQLKEKVKAIKQSLLQTFTL